MSFTSVSPRLRNLFVSLSSIVLHYVSQYNTAAANFINTRCWLSMLPKPILHSPSRVVLTCKVGIIVEPVHEHDYVYEQ